MNLDLHTTDWGKRISAPPSHSIVIYLYLSICICVCVYVPCILVCGVCGVGCGVVCACVCVFNKIPPPLAVVANTNCALRERISWRIGERKREEERVMASGEEVEDRR